MFIGVQLVLLVFDILYKLLCSSITLSGAIFDNLPQVFMPVVLLVNMSEA